MEYNSQKYFHLVADLKIQWIIQNSAIIRDNWMWMDFGRDVQWATGRVIWDIRWFVLLVSANKNISLRIAQMLPSVAKQQVNNCNKLASTVSYFGVSTDDFSFPFIIKVKCIHISLWLWLLGAHRETLWTQPNPYIRTAVKQRDTHFERSLIVTL